MMAQRVWVVCVLYSNGTVADSATCAHTGGWVGNYSYLYQKSPNAASMGQSNIKRPITPKEQETAKYPLPFTYT